MGITAILAIAAWNVSRHGQFICARTLQLPARLVCWSHPTLAERPRLRMRDDPMHPGELSHTRPTTGRTIRLALVATVLGIGLTVLLVRLAAPCVDHPGTCSDPAQAMVFALIVICTGSVAVAVYTVLLGSLRHIAERRDRTREDDPPGECCR